jgi:polyisoprenoid-binding protein YceI
MKRILLILLLAVGSISSQAQLKVKSSSVKFKIKNFGINVDGSFSGFSTSLSFKPNNLAKSKITASVKVNTIKTGIAARDKHLKSDDYFDAEKYPTISLKSTKFTKIKGNKYTGFFNVTIKNKTKEISFPFTYISKKNGDKIFSGTFTVNRRSFGVGGSSISMSDNATVYIEVVLGK